MDAHSVAIVLDDARDRLAAGEDVTSVLDHVFGEGYGYGLRQGHFDMTPEGMIG